MAGLFLTRSLASGLLIVSSVVQAFPFYHESATNGTIRPRLYQQFRIKDCSSAATTVIETAMGEIPQVLERTAERLDELISALRTPGFDATEDLSLEDWSTLDTFGVLYGNLLNTRGHAKEHSVDILIQYLDFVELLQNRVTDLASQSLDIICDSGWAKETDNNNESYESATGSDGTDYYYDDSGNGFGWMQLNMVCQKVPILEGFAVSMSSNMVVQGENTLISIISICPFASGRAPFSSSLTTLRGNDYAKSDSLEGLASQTATFLLLHELSHAWSLVGSDYKLDNAYTWAGCANLVIQDTDDEDTNDKDKNQDALSNADSFSFFTVAMFLDQNTWYTGEAFPLIENLWSFKDDSSDVGSPNSE